jgi:undecaprenyl-diphosphatase
VTVLEAVLLGLVQGLTEFLPVSSSGHLVLGQALLGLELPGVAFELMLHLATVCAVFWVYRAAIARLIGGVFRGDRASLAYAGLLAAASVPAALAGTLAATLFEGAYERPIVAASMLLVTGFWIWTIRWSGPRARESRPGIGSAVAIGIAQALAILPGVSRSGSTVATGVWLGVEVDRMAEFSFLLSLPAILGAGFLQFGGADSGLSASGAVPLVAGFATACLSGVLAIRIFLSMLKSRKFHRFSYYCWAVGLAYLGAAILVPGLR